MTYSDKLELIGLAKSAMKTPLGESGIDCSIIQAIHPGAETISDLDIEDLSIIMYVEGYLRCKQENQNIIEIAMTEGKPASEIFSRLVGKEYVYDEETKTRVFKEVTHGEDNKLD